MRRVGHAGDVIVILETRYGGVYEGGSWAAFSVSSHEAVPEDAFGGDPEACGWWGNPTVPVGVGDSPNEALARLEFLMARDRGGKEDSYFAVGDLVRTARCTPSDWYGDGVGIVRAVEFRPLRPYVGGLRGDCVYTVEFDDAAAGVQVPEAYLRPGQIDDKS